MDKWMNGVIYWMDQIDEWMDGDTGRLIDGQTENTNNSTFYFSSQ